MVMYKKADVLAAAGVQSDAAVKCVYEDDIGGEYSAVGRTVNVGYSVDKDGDEVKLHTVTALHPYYPEMVEMFYRQLERFDRIDRNQNRALEDHDYVQAFVDYLETAVDNYLERIREDLDWDEIDALPENDEVSRDLELRRKYCKLIRNDLISPRETWITDTGAGVRVAYYFALAEQEWGSEYGFWVTIQHYLSSYGEDDRESSSFLEILSALCDDEEQAL